MCFYSMITAFMDQAFIAGSKMFFTPKHQAVKNTEIVVYCRSGRRSAIAAETLISLGYAKIYDLGAVSSWTYGLEK